MANTLNIKNMSYRYNYPQTNYKTKSNSCNLGFGGNLSIPQNRLNRITEFYLKKLGMLKRLLNNKIKNKKIGDKIALFYQEIINVDESSPEYIKHLYNYSRNFGKGKEVEINLESRRILDIVHSDDSCIFIMNHDNRKKDPAMLGILYTLLHGAYIKAGKASICPRPKIIVNEDILSAMDDKRRAILEKFGTIGIDASLFSSNETNNSKKMFPLMRDFNRNKVNLFIFPEGKMAMFKDLDLKYKFQTGIAEMVNAVARTKKAVKVVPIGFSYNEKSKQFLGSIHVGETVYFKRDGQNLLVNKGNIGSNFASSNYVDFFRKNESREDGFRAITDEGRPIAGKDLSDYIAGILCENLKICKEEAKRQLPNNSLGDEVIKM